MEKGQIFLIPTPIGNMEDISLRAKKVLEEVDLILCEDTRHSGILLKEIGVKNKLMSYHDHNEAERSQEVLDLVKEGKNIGLISDAGMPGISDPGQVLVDLAHERGIGVSVLPGPSAVIAAVVGAGFEPGRFQFLGFLPKKSGQKEEALRETIGYPGLSVFYESPHRLVDTLEVARQIFPNRRILVAREISKIYEELYRGSVEEAYDRFKDGAKGEIVLVFDEYEEGPPDYEEELRRLIKEGMSPSRAAKTLAGEYKISKNYLYDLSIKISNED